VSSPGLAAAVDERLPEMIAFTRELVGIPTENPPGNQYPRCAEALMTRLDGLGMHPRMLGECVLASVGEGPRLLRFHGHYDVVPHSAAGQFEPRLEGGNLFGRGSSDMKGGLAAMIYAADALARSGEPLAGRIELVIVPDEETGGARGTACLERSGFFDAECDGMLTAEPTSGVIWNASRGAISLRVTVHGKPAHVGLSCQGVNAFEGMLAVAQELRRLQAEIQTRETAWRITPHAARRSILMLGGECRGGSNFNVVPDVCSFTVDRRTNPEENLAEEKARLLDLFELLRRGGIDLDYELMQEGGASGTPPDHPLAVALTEAVAEAAGRAPEMELCPGLLECRYYAAYGIPALAYGPGLLAVSHGPHEFVPVERIRDCALAYAPTARSLWHSGAYGPPARPPARTRHAPRAGSNERGASGLSTV
jgi:acetylornithine deacetylase/succinyl-diaminopimelate desuccinylase family protein